MSINKTDLDNHITRHDGDDQFDWIGEETPDQQEERYAKARKVSILELLDCLSARDRRIADLEREVKMIRGYLAHALRQMGNIEDADALAPAV